MATRNFDPFRQAEDELVELAGLTTREALQIAERYHGGGYLSPDEFEEYRYILDDWDSGLEPIGRWKKGRVHLREPEIKLLMLFRGADVSLSPGGIQGWLGIPRQVQADWVTEGHVRAFVVKGDTYASMLDVRDRARALRTENGGRIGNGSGTAPVMLDQMLSGLVGTIHSKGGQGGGHLSESTGAEFAQDLLNKQREGRL